MDRKYQEELYDEAHYLLWSDHSVTLTLEDCTIEVILKWGIDEIIVDDWNIVKGSSNKYEYSLPKEVLSQVYKTEKFKTLSQRARTLLKTIEKAFVDGYSDFLSYVESDYKNKKEEFSKKEVRLKSE